MLREKTKDALMAYLKALEEYAYTRGDGPFFAEDRVEAENNLDIKRNLLEKALEEE